MLPMERLGLRHQPWNSLRAAVEETLAEVNFELVEPFTEREEERLDLLWPASARAGEEASRSARCADRGRRLWQQSKKNLSQRRGTPQQ